eukprot:TRINITY_DN10617_c0_g1_i1.p2 TRINITY_DN10617_c0_g1~~TRINITY_DN10617_c0_g1_i1.p2  ORF type:complete len:112 (+),score=14.86 TRINITY_DN10617_c0_g1_i1:30-365(+)
MILMGRRRLRMAVMIVLVTIVLLCWMGKSECRAQLNEMKGEMEGNEGELLVLKKNDGENLQSLIQALQNLITNTQEGNMEATGSSSNLSPSRGFSPLLFSILFTLFLVFVL